MILAFLIFLLYYLRHLQPLILLLLLADLHYQYICGEPCDCLLACEVVQMLLFTVALELAVNCF